MIFLRRLRAATIACRFEIGHATAFHHREVPSNPCFFLAALIGPAAMDAARE
jgi:hypothetical protein